MANRNLNHAQQAKNNEFFTQSEDIESELQHYTKHFAGKVVYLNCDDPTTSNFWRYFYRSFSYLKLKKLIATHYELDGSSSYALIYEGGSDNAESFAENVEKVQLTSDGDFRSDECISYLKQSDIVVTNPPFSLFREYVATLEKYGKKFIIWGNQNAITYKEFFPLLQKRKVWLGSIANKTCFFRIPADYKKWDKKETEKRHDGHHYAKVPAISVFTNLPLEKATDQMIIWRDFSQADYPAYDNYAGFEVSKVVDIPKDTTIQAEITNEDIDGWKNKYGADLSIVKQNEKTTIVKINRPVWMVPITFLTKYNPSSNLDAHNLGKEFEIVGITDRQNTWKWRFKKYTEDDDPKYNDFNAHPVLKINGNYKNKYARVLIRVKKGVHF